jgi:hypothetical protein
VPCGHRCLGPRPPGFTVWQRMGLQIPSRIDSAGAKIRISRIAWINHLSRCSLKFGTLLPCFVEGAAGSGSLHAGQRLAKPGLSGFSSNSSLQTEHTLIGNAILLS